MPLRKLQERLQYERTAGARLMLLWAAMMWAASLALPPETFGRSAYRLMADIMSEGGWTAAFVVYAMALCIPSRPTLGRWAVIMSVHVVGAVMWGTIALCILVGNGWHSAGSTPNCALALASCWVLLKAPRCPKREAEDAQS